MENETWKEIPGFNGYYASNIGNIKKVDGLSFSEKVLKQSNFKDRHLIVRILKDGKYKMCSVHRLIAFAFLDKVEGKSNVVHKDKNTKNNNAKNLLYANWEETLEISTLNRLLSPKKNIKAMERHSTPVEYCDSKGNPMFYPSIREAARKNNVSRTKMAMMIKIYNQLKIAVNKNIFP